MHLVPWLCLAKLSSVKANSSLSLPETQSDSSRVVPTGVTVLCALPYLVDFETGQSFREAQRQFPRSCGSRSRAAELLARKLPNKILPNVNRVVRGNKSPLSEKWIVPVDDCRLT
jgi:hypothetical protein